MKIIHWDGVKKHGEPIVTIRTGSHLYGTNTPESDEDYKGVFIASLKNIILNNVPKHACYSTSTDTERNTKNDIDYEYKELRIFLKETLAGQTYAIEMLFANKENIVQQGPLWKTILNYRDKLVSKNLKPFIGYCKSQASKYCIKGEKLKELEKIIGLLERMKKKSYTLNALLFFHNLSLNGKYVKWQQNINDKDQGAWYLNVLGKLYRENTHVEEVLKSLKRLHSKYGKRTHLTKEENGIDWKAISHAYRVVTEFESILIHHKLTFPLVNAPYIKGIKQGKYKLEEVQQVLEIKLNQIDETMKRSTLSDKPDYDFWEKFILDIYEKGKIDA